MVENLWALLSSAAEVWHPLFLGLTSLIETLFPPFPGDVVFVALAGLAWRSGMPWWLMLSSGLAGCLVSTIVLDRIGRSQGLEKLEKLVIGTSGRNGLKKARAAIASKGVWILVASRFIPGIRSLLIIAASSSGISRNRVIFCAGSSAALWYGILTAAGYFAGSTLDGAEEFMSGFTEILWAIIALTVISGAVVFLYKMRRMER